MIGGFWWVAVRVARQLARGSQTADVAAQGDRRALLALTAGLMGLVTNMLAHGLVDHSFFLVDLSYVFFLALAAIQHIAGFALTSHQQAGDVVKAAISPVASMGK